MAITNPRNRLVYFRVTEEEYQRFSDLCQVEGARSISDMARTAIQRTLEEGRGNDPVTRRLNQLDQTLAQVNAALSQITRLLEERGAVNGEHVAASLSTLSGSEEESPCV